MCIRSTELSPFDGKLEEFSALSTPHLSLKIAEIKFKAIFSCCIMCTHHKLLAFLFPVHLYSGCFSLGRNNMMCGFWSVEVAVDVDAIAS